MCVVRRVRTNTKVETMLAVAISEERIFSRCYLDGFVMGACVNLIDYPRSVSQLYCRKDNLMGKTGRYISVMSKSNGFKLSSPTL